MGREKGGGAKKTTSWLKVGRRKKTTSQWKGGNEKKPLLGERGGGEKSSLWICEGGRNYFHKISKYENFHKKESLMILILGNICSLRFFENLNRCPVMGSKAKSDRGEENIFGAIHESFLHGNLYKIAYLNNWNISTFCFYNFQEFQSTEELWLRGAISHQLHGVAGSFTWTSLHGNFYKIAYLNNWNISTFCFYSFQEFECAEELWLRGAISRQLYGVEEFFHELLFTEIFIK